MSDTRNHTTRDQLAAVLAEHRISRWSDHTYGCRSCANHYEQTAEPFDMSEYGRLSKPDWTYEEAMTHLADALLASDAIAAVRAAAVAETTATIEALPRLRRWIDDSELVDLNDVRAALSGGRTAPPGQWDEEADAMFIDKAREAMRDTRQEPR